MAGRGWLAQRGTISARTPSSMRTGRASESPDSLPRLAFFLGGNDLEMETIRDLLGSVDPRRVSVHDRRLPWGARASDYGRELFVGCSKQGGRPVLVELPDDLA